MGAGPGRPPVETMIGIICQDLFLMSLGGLFVLYVGLIRDNWRNYRDNTYRGKHRLSNRDESVCCYICSLRPEIRNSFTLYKTRPEYGNRLRETRELARGRNLRNLEIQNARVRAPTDRNFHTFWYS